MVFCIRRAALHHLEGLWEDNLFTVEGTQAHEKAHEGDRRELRGDVMIVRGLRLRSLALGLTGIADVVEFHRIEQGEAGCGIELPEVAGLWRPFPVEYKRGRLRHERSFQVQLCAQALCLEEMLGVPVPRGALYYGKSRRRTEMDLDPEMRAETRDAAARFHEILRSQATPPPEPGPKCDSCSIEPLCMPRTAYGSRSARRYLQSAFDADPESEG